MIETVILSSIATKIFDKWVFPNLLVILDESKDIISSKIREQYLVHFKNNFKNYLKQRIDKLSIIDTIVFPNMQVLLDDVYIPLNLYTLSSKNNHMFSVVNKYPKELFENNNKVIIIDSAGMGKSTILKKIFIECAKSSKRIPFLIELSKIDRENSIIDQMRNQLNPINSEIDEDIVTKLVSKGNFLIILDGYDEIKSSDLDVVNRQITLLTEKASRNKYIISSRPEADTIASLGDFLKYAISPLKRDESFKLLKKYDKYNRNSISDKLIGSIESNLSESIMDFLKNPMLTSLLYRAYDFKKDIPLRKNEFYRQVFEALFMSHDYTKDGYLKREKKSNLAIDDFDKILRYIAFITSRVGEVEYTKNKILFYIEKAKDYQRTETFMPSDFFQDILVSVPLFKKDGLSYKWSHKSIQDYFSAKFIWLDIKSNYSVFFESIYKNNRIDKMYNILDILYDLDAKVFVNNLGIRLAKDYVSFYKSQEAMGVSPVKIPFLYNNKTFFGKSIQGTKSSHFSKVVEGHVKTSGAFIVGTNFNLPMNGTNFNFNAEIYMSNRNLGVLQLILAHKKSKIVKVDFSGINPSSIASIDYFIDELEIDKVINVTEELLSLPEHIQKAYIKLILSSVYEMNYDECLKMIDEVDGSDDSDEIFNW